MPMKKNTIDENNNNNYIKTRIICTIIMILVAVALPVMVKSTKSLEYSSLYSNFVVGEIADENVYASNSIDLVDTDATETQKVLASSNVYPVFSFSPIKSIKLVDTVDKVRTSLSTNDFNSAANIVGTSLAYSLQEVNDSVVYSISYDLINEISDKGLFDSAEIATVIEQGYNFITLSNQLRADGSLGYEEILDLENDEILTSDNVAGYISNKLSEISDSLTAKQILLIESLVFKVLEPTVSYDETLTSRRRDQAENAVSPVILSITKGDLLIEENRVVTYQQKELLDMLAKQSGGVSAIDVIGWILFDSVGLISSFYILEYF